MTLLILGLLLFLGVHSVRIVAEPWRQRRMAAWGEPRWKGMYSLASVLGFALIVIGYGTARSEPVALWLLAPWTRHLAALLTLPAFILLVAAYVPGNRIKSAIGHPMVAGVKLWAVAHLLANGNLADLLLFGSFLVWAILSFRAARRRDRAAGVERPTGSTVRTALTVAIGMAAWGGFAMALHVPLIGVRPY